MADAARTRDTQAHRSEQISDFTSEVSKIASRTVKDMELGPKATTAKNAVSDFVSEVSNLGRVSYMRNQTRIAASTTPARYVTASLS